MMRGDKVRFEPKEDLRPQAEQTFPLAVVEVTAKSAKTDGSEISADVPYGGEQGLHRALYTVKVVRRVDSQEATMPGDFFVAPSGYE